MQIQLLHFWHLDFENMLICKISDRVSIFIFLLWDFYLNPFVKEAVNIISIHLLKDTVTIQTDLYLDLYRNSFVRDAVNN